MVFSLSALWWRRIRGLWKLPGGRDWLEGETGSCSDGSMLSKSLIQFSVDGWGCVPSLLFDLRPNYGGGNEDNGDLLRKVHSAGHALLPSVPPTLQLATANPWLCPRLLDTHGRVSVGLLGHCSFLLACGVHKVLFVPSKSIKSILCKTWTVHAVLLCLFWIETEKRELGWAA